VPSDPDDQPARTPLSSKRIPLCRDADARSALEELRNCNLVRALVEGDYVDFILCHAKEPLIKGGKDAGLTDIRTCWSKAKLIKYFLANVTFKTAHDYCDGGEFIALGDTEPVEFMLYLYFGKTEDDLKNFALRDLGIIRTNKNANLSARFTDEAEARACLTSSKQIPRKSTAAPLLRCSAARNAQRTTRATCVTRSLTE
jgi:DNA polymerase III subunit epsilon